MVKPISKAHAFFNEVEHEDDDLGLDPMAPRTKNFLTRVNDYDLKLMDICARHKRMTRSNMLRFLVEDYAREKGII